MSLYLHTRHGLMACRSLRGLRVCKCVTCSYVRYKLLHVSCHTLLTLHLRRLHVALRFNALRYELRMGKYGLRRSMTVSKCRVSPSSYLTIDGC